jgi:hypothetical protein
MKVHRARISARVAGRRTDTRSPREPRHMDVPAPPQVASEQRKPRLSMRAPEVVAWIPIRGKNTHVPAPPQVAGAQRKPRLSMRAPEGRGMDARSLDIYVWRRRLVFGSLSQPFISKSRRFRCDGFAGKRGISHSSNRPPADPSLEAFQPYFRCSYGQSRRGKSRQ